VGGVVWVQAVKERGSELIIGMPVKFAEVERVSSVGGLRLLVCYDCV
jgi:hypothetical protein